MKLKAWLPPALGIGVDRFQIDIVDAVNEVENDIGLGSADAGIGERLEDGLMKISEIPFVSPVTSVLLRDVKTNLLLSAENGCIRAVVHRSDEIAAYRHISYCAGFRVLTKL